MRNLRLLKWWMLNCKLDGNILKFWNNPVSCRVEFDVRSVTQAGMTSVSADSVALKMVKGIWCFIKDSKFSVNFWTTVPLCLLGCNCFSGKWGFKCWTRRGYRKWHRVLGAVWPVQNGMESAGFPQLLCWSCCNTVTISGEYVSYGRKPEHLCVLAPPAVKGKDIRLSSHCSRVNLSKIKTGD